MKKKILLTSFAFMLVVVALAICVGATTIYRDIDGNEIFRYEADEVGITTTYEPQPAWRGRCPAGSRPRPQRWNGR